MTGEFQAFEAKMRGEGLPDLAIRAFEQSFEALSSGATGLIAESDISPLHTLQSLDEIKGHSDAGQQVIGRTVVLKLNGGLGTSMGMTRAKSLLPAKDGMSFLELITRQVLSLRERFDCRIPLVLMNSFRTRDDSLAVLAQHPAIDMGLDLDFVQHKVPRIVASDLTPVAWPKDPSYEWCPPGHGDIYTALTTSGMLPALLDAGYEYAFVSNSDNLGATLDLGILGWLASEEIPFLMEVADRTAADRKGGHLATSIPSGRLILRESAQCARDDERSFQDIEKHRYFNTNNIWLDLRALRDRLEETGGVLSLPMIRNEKTVDPRDSNSAAVIQLETAMGSAISSFDDARALRVSRERFSPVKTTSDLLALWSDAYQLMDDFQVCRDPAVSPDLAIDLGKEHYGRIDEFMKRFPDGAPSLRDCRSLRLSGDIRFGKNVVLRGGVELTNREPEPLEIDDGTRLGF